MCPAVWNHLWKTVCLFLIPLGSSRGKMTVYDFIQKAEWESFVLALLPSLDSVLSRSPFQRISLDLCWCRITEWLGLVAALEGSSPTFCSEQVHYKHIIKLCPAGFWIFPGLASTLSDFFQCLSTLYREKVWSFYEMKSIWNFQMNFSVFQCVPVAS